MNILSSQRIDSNSYPLWPFALLTALLPLLTIHTTYVVSAIEGYVEWCLPYWHSCTSISKTGRYGSAYFIFKGAMIPAALLMLFWWWLCRQWLVDMGVRNRYVAALPWIGLVAALSLLFYTLALGHAGDGFRLIRRIGVVFAFALTYVGQLLVSASLLKTRWRNWGQKLLLLSAFTLAVGLLTLFLDLLVHGFWKQVEDAFEWVLALLVNTHALLLALLWKRSHYRFYLRQT